MKTYTYTCRNKDGTLKRGQLEASGRADALHQLKSQGRLPLSLSEGASAAHPGKKKHLAAAAAAAALIAVIAGVVFLLSAPSQQQSRKPQSPKATPETRQPLKNNTQQKTAARADNHLTQATEDGEAETLAGATEAQTSLTAAMPGDNAALLDEKVPEEKPAPAFRTMSEQLIAMLGQPGEERPPLPDLSGETLEADFLRASTNVLVITDNDSDALAAAKENVAWVKSYIEEAKKMGWTPGEYIRELENVRKQQAMDRRQALLLMAEIERDYPDDADAARTELNRDLEEKGILPLPAPTDE